MKVLSLFDGISGLQQALQRSNIKYDTYYASEIDKYAIKATMHNFPDTIQLGSVIDVDVSKLPKIDLLGGGSPCQSFSFAGKRKGMSTTDAIEILTLEHYLELKASDYTFEGQSYLFWEYIRILTDIRKTNPDVKFLLENVEMGEKWERVLSRAIGVNGIHINSTLVSAQNRQRIYWCNFGMVPQGLFGEMTSIIKQPKDKGVFLKDILETDVDEKYYLSEKATIRHSIGIRNSPITDTDGKSGSLLSNQYKMGSDALCVAERGRALTPKRTEFGKQIRKEYEAGSIKSERKNIQQLEPRTDGKTNCLTSVQKDNLVVQLNESKESGGKQPFQQNRVYDTNGKSPALQAQLSTGSDKILEKRKHQQDDSIAGKSVCLSALGGGGGAKTGLYLVEPPIVHNMSPRSGDPSKGGTGDLSRTDGKTYCLQTSDINRVEYKQRIRRLTPIECCRLQTVADNYFKDKDGKYIISESQQYKALGNGWTIDVIVFLLGYY